MLLSMFKLNASGDMYRCIIDPKYQQDFENDGFVENPGDLKKAKPKRKKTNDSKR